MHSRKLINWITKTNTRSLAKLAGRPKLPGSNGKGFPALLNETPKTFPYKIRAQDHGVNEDTSPGKCADALSGTYKQLLYEHGAILLQGFPLGEPRKYNKFLKHLDGVTQMFYSQAGGVRHAVEELVYAASDYSSDASIEPHNEMSHASNYPKIVSFSCMQAGTGGESVLVDSFAWFDKMDRSVADEFERKDGVMYHQYLKENTEAYNGKQLGADVSWKYVFQTDSKTEVEKQLKMDNREFIWHEDNSLELWFSKPATINHHISGKTSWFNQSTMHHATFYTDMYPDTWGKSGIPLNRFPFHTYYGDGTEISTDVIQHIRNVAWSVAVGFQMQKNEVIMIDNERFAHARLDYIGERKLFAALLNDTNCNK